jgi:hypothetical protein
VGAKTREIKKMGVDLTLVPDRFESGSRPILGYTRLPLMCRWYRLHEVLRSVANPLLEGLMWYADEGIETVKVDAYGDDLRWVLPSQFLKAASDTTENLEPWDKAVVAFIRELPPMTRIVLWFH